MTDVFHVLEVSDCYEYHDSDKRVRIKRSKRARQIDCLMRPLQGIYEKSQRSLLRPCTTQFQVW